MKPSMKLALIGYGKMGKMVEQIAIDKGHTVVAVLSSAAATRHMTSASLRDAEVCIDFSHPNNLLHTVERAAALKRDLVIGTTGWEDQFDAIKKIVEQYNIGCVYSPNFSIGVNIFLQIIKEASKIINQFDEYDAAGHEVHHNQKADCPSGTAKMIAQTMIEAIQRKKEIVHELGNRKINPHELHFSAVRCGFAPGTHEVTFDSTADTITIKHTVRDRTGFALGAVAAAEWIKGKKGFFTVQDMINSMIQ